MSEDTGSFMNNAIRAAAGIHPAEPEVGVRTAESEDRQNLAALLTESDPILESWVAANGAKNPALVVKLLKPEHGGVDYPNQLSLLRLAHPNLFKRTRTKPANETMNNAFRRTSGR